MTVALLGSRPTHAASGRTEAGVPVYKNRKKTSKRRYVLTQGGREQKKKQKDYWNSI